MRGDLYSQALRAMLRQQRRRAIMNRIDEVEASLTDEERAEERAITDAMQRATGEALRTAAKRGESW